MSFPLVLAVVGALVTSHAPAEISVAVKARSIQPGELVVLDVTTTEPTRALHARAFGRDLAAFSVDARTWRVLVGVDLNVAAGTYTVSLRAELATGETKASHRLAVTAKTFPRRTLKVDAAFVDPPASEVPRIQAEAKLLTDLWTRWTPKPLWTTAFVRPVPEAANSAFGTRSVFNGQTRNPHSGADFASPAGTPVRAPNAGRAVLARDLYFSGKTIVLDHGLGVFSLLAHLSSIDVDEGVVVASGATVGRVGATGRVTGPHLHWALRVGGARVDPLSLLALLGE